jgi:hypothetical protein
MKRSELKRTGFKPRAAGEQSTLKRSEMKRSSGMKPGKPLKSGGQLARQVKPMRSRSKTNSDPRPKTGEAKLCKGQPCYLRIPGICTGQAHDPCHSNQAIHGKGKSIKAHDVFTVPGCRACHNELDQGLRYTREEKFAIWDDAYARWEPARAALVLQR